jgi:hypothetical protein
MHVYQQGLRPVAFGPIDTQSIKRFDPPTCSLCGKPATRKVRGVGFCTFHREAATREAKKWAPR